MKQWLTKLREKWNGYVGDRELELAIRREMVQRGLARSSPIREVRLAAIERPGWIQVYEFQVQDLNSRTRWFGVARDDGRKGTEVALFDHADLRDTQFRAWSQGMILRPSRR